MTHSMRQGAATCVEYVKLECRENDITYIHSHNRLLLYMNVYAYKCRSTQHGKQWLCPILRQNSRVHTAEQKHKICYSVYSSVAKTLFHVFIRFLLYDSMNLMCEFSVRSTPQHLYCARTAAYDNEAHSSKQNMCWCLRLSGQHFADPTNFNANELHKTGSSTFRVFIKVASTKFWTSIIYPCIKCLQNNAVYSDCRSAKRDHRGDHCMALAAGLSLLPASAAFLLVFFLWGGTYAPVRSLLQVP
jgi:hypothetical protein